MEKNSREVDEIAGSTGSMNLYPLKQEQNSITDLSGHVHHLPCCIKYTGPTDVSHYFNPISTGVEVDGLQVEEAFFRGRKLQGVSVPLPAGYSGFILGKKKSSKNQASKTGGSGENSWGTVAKCGNMTFWNHDSLPSRDDASLRLFHLFAVAKAMHEPLSTEDLKSAFVAKQ